MFILHPFSDDRLKDKAETWAFVAEARKAGYDVKDVRVQRETYPDLMGEYWGHDDLIILEDDKVPTMQDLAELIECKRLACIFPYPFSYKLDTKLEEWLPPSPFPYGMGFVKFRLEAQLVVPFKDWHRYFRNNEFDKIVEVPMVRKLGPMHVHQRMIKHNHAPKLREVAGGYYYRLRQATTDTPEAPF